MDEKKNLKKKTNYDNKSVISKGNSRKKYFYFVNIKLNNKDY